MVNFITVLFLVVLSLSAPAVWGESGFHSYLFDGATFREGKAEGAVLVKDGRLPQVGEVSAREDLLPEGTGAVALFCYLQGAGGKLKRLPRVIPVAGAAVSVQGEGLTLAARTDGAGYLILALPPGSYEFRLSGFSKRVAIEKGKTTLTFLRAGKRMGD
jgi:hypothetical protein